MVSFWRRESSSLRGSRRRAAKVELKKHKRSCRDASFFSSSPPRTTRFTISKTAKLTIPRNTLSSALIPILLTKMSNPTANVTPTTGPAPSLVVNDPRAEMLRGVGSWAETPENTPFPSHAGNLPQCQSHCSLLLIFVARVLTARSR